MKSEMSAEEAQMFRQQFDKMRRKHIILPENKNIHTHWVFNDSPRFNYHTQHEPPHTFRFPCFAARRASESLTLNVNLTGYLWQRDSGRKRTHTQRTQTHARHRKARRQTSTARETWSPSAAVCRYTVSKADPFAAQSPGVYRSSWGNH